MKNLLGAVVLLGGLLVSGSAFAQPDTNNDGCVDQPEAILAVVNGTTAGTELEIQNEYVLVFSNPAEVTYFRVNFENGCMISSEIIDQVAFDNMKGGV